MFSRDLLLQAAEIRPGDHLVALYNQEQEIEHYTTSYIHASLMRNERCLYITGDVDTSAVLRQLETLKSNVGEQGDLVVLDKSDVYAKNGKFSPDRLIGLIQTTAEEALDDGYSALAVTGELSWVLDYEDGEELIVEYEWKLNEYVFNRYPVSALCRYSMSKFPAGVIRDVIQTHPFIIWQGKIHENPYYVLPEGFKDDSMAQYQVQGWLENIDSFTDTKSRFTMILEEQKEELRQLHEKMTSGIIMSFLRLLETHDPYTKDHCQNVAILASKLAERLHMSDKFATKIYYAALVHDIGKTLIPREVLNNPGRLSDEEYNQIKMHPIYGSAPFGEMDEFQDIALAIRHHHEFYDGNGYPDGLTGNDIPLMSRIIAICDSYDAITNDRPYRKARSHDEALAELMRCAGKQFDPELIRHFSDLF